MSKAAVCTLLIISMIEVSIGSGSKGSFPVESGIGSNEMKKCYKTKLDHMNPNHRCNYILQNILLTDTFIPKQTSCIASVFDIQPVQYCIGSSIVSCKQKYYEILVQKSKESFIEFQDKNPTPAMLFYKNDSDTELGIYVFDHQHMSYALATSDIIPLELKYLKICITYDLRKKFQANEMDLFWSHMIDVGYSYPYDQYYVYKDPVQYMPATILQLVDDPFRSLAIYVQDYMGFIFCNDPQETITALNFSKCFGKKGVKWQQKYGNVGLTLIWSDFLYSVLQDNEYALQLYMDNNTMHQMQLFRKLLPVAMNISLNKSSGAKKLPSFNNEPAKIPYLGHLDLYDDGCDIPMQREVWSRNGTMYNITGMMVMLDEAGSFSALDKYLIGVCIMGAAAIMVELRRYYLRKTQLDEECNLQNISINAYGSTCKR